VKPTRGKATQKRGTGKKILRQSRKERKDPSKKKDQSWELPSTQSNVEERIVLDKRSVPTLSEIGKKKTGGTKERRATTILTKEGSTLK